MEIEILHSHYEICIIFRQYAYPTVLTVNAPDQFAPENEVEVTEGVQ
jgi:hypothetical protein